MVKIHINKECNDKNELSVLLRHIADLIDKGESYGNTWELIDISERQEKIEFIKKVLFTWGDTSTTELELESSPVYNNLTGKICTLVEEFTEDYVRVVTYDDDIYIHEVDIPYEKLSDELIDEIYDLIEQYNIVQEKLYDSIRDEDF